MANEKSALNRSWQAACYAANWWLIIPIVAFMMLAKLGPHELSTDTEVMTWQIIYSLSFAANLICIFLMLHKALPAGWNEYRYGEAMRRTGLSLHQLATVINLVPYTLTDIQQQMLKSWTSDQLLNLYREEKLHEARSALSEAELRCRIYQTDNSAFNATEFMTNAKADYQRKLTELEKLTTIPS